MMFRFLGITILLLLLGEFIVRLFVTSPSAITYDKELGWVWKPGTAIFHTKEGWATNKINSLGFNDGEVSLKNKSDSVLVMGDSYTEALQVPQTKNFTSVIEEQLGCISVFNAGRSGLSPIHYPLIVERLKYLVMPTKTVVVITAGDMSDLRATKATIHTIDKKITDITLREREVHWLRKEMDIIFQFSALASHLKNRLKSLVTDKDRSKNTVSNKPSNPHSQEELFNVLAYVFTKINAIAPLHVVFIPSLEYRPHGNISTNQVSDEFEEIVRNAAIANQIPFISARKFMEKSYRDYLRPPVGFSNNDILRGHLNEIGHEDVADALIEIMQVKCNVEKKTERINS